jgi:hypothetical protein
MVRLPEADFQGHYGPAVHIHGYNKKNNDGGPGSYIMTGKTNIPVGRGRRIA